MNVQIAVLKATCLLLSNDVYNYLFLSHSAQHAHGERLKLLPLQNFNEPVSTEKKNHNTHFAKAFVGTLFTVLVCQL